MSDATVITIAKGVVADINGASLSQTFTAVRAYRPTYDLKDLQSLKVTVVPHALEGELVTRADAQEQHQIDVAVQKKVNVDSLDAVDPLMLLVEQIKDLLLGEHPSTMATATCIRATNEPIYDPALMQEKRVFCSVLTLTYDVIRTP